jgi:CRP/FNR family transcriptional regulator, cyclic AMP receptor protein
MESLERILREHPFFATISAEHLKVLTGCAKNHRFAAGEYLCREGAPANEFFLVRHGKVALEIAAPGKTPIVFETVGDGEIAGASWLVPPYRWNFDARALQLTRAIGLDADCLRGKCDADPQLGYDMMKAFLPILVNRLQATRLQILDVYGRS